MCVSQVGNAIKSSLRGAALKSNNKEGARSIQVEITPTSSRISRNAVTSLSIRGHRWKRHGETHTQGNIVVMYEHFHSSVQWNMRKALTHTGIKNRLVWFKDQIHDKGESKRFRSLHHPTTLSFHHPTVIVSSVKCCCHLSAPRTLDSS